MKKLLIAFTMCCLIQAAYAQKLIVDESIRYQQERMVFKQWDKNKFTPTSGFLGLNPYYWLTWGLHPNYKKTDIRPLSPAGPQTQRLALTAAMTAASNAYSLESDTLRNTSLLEIANQSGALSAADPLWLLYYKKELSPVLEYSDNSILAPLPQAVRSKVISEGLLSWYKNELSMLKERIEGARNADMDRGSRILTYHRMLLEYRALEATWETRTATAKKNINNSGAQEKIKSDPAMSKTWTPETDEQIAREILKNRKY
ncbi:hypothetical protein [Pedobacter hiemivivus]|uniref:DUF5045 domain-containing protein n=1 Tax=Pedobacter hiemivivus TaxID=2530454 RepID=A0A4R0NEC7_9SPHI|nr:hypothetical protein [Pedobacter hiemivivus]TCC98781.1 hypothetical protein EZ444_05765 [Pedobacter hiemivivus]